MCRGAYISLFPIIGYVLILTKKDKAVFLLTIISIISILLVIMGPKLTLFLTAREIHFSEQFFYIPNVAGRFESSLYTLKRLLTEFPNFFVGFGFGTYENWDDVGIGGTAGVNSVHQGLLSIWVSAGLTGLIGFLACEFYIYRSFFKKWKSLPYSWRILLGGIIISLSSWIVFQNTTSYVYAGGWVEVYAILATLLGLAIALTQKISINEL